MPDSPSEMDADRVQLDADRVGADGDQAAADGDQAAADLDQAAADWDQAASDRDLASGGDRQVHDASAGRRDRASFQRHRGGLQRGKGGASRDVAAAARDREAEARDRAAATRDRELEQRDGKRGPQGSGAARRRAAAARARAAADREQAAQDRRYAARYRAEAAEERAALLRQVAVSELDALTGARARAPGLADIKLEINRAERLSAELTVAYVDLEGLKIVNDTQGHAAGDAMLEGTVRVIRSHLRSYDVIVRIGGDEFVCVMSGATVEDAQERFNGIQIDAAAVGIGIKFGIATLEPGDGPSDLIERADAELLSKPGPPTPVAPDAACLDPAQAGRPRILVTDDRPETMAAVNSALAERYECEFAGSLNEASEMLAADAFDLLLCDLHSGGAPAMSFARKVIGEDHDTAVLLIGEEEDPLVAEEAFEFGAFGYVVRPLPGQLLISTMNALRRRDLETSHRRLAQSQASNRQTIIDMVPIAIYAKDTSGRYEVANAMAEELGGVEPGAMLGQTDDALMSTADAESYTADDRRILDGGMVLEREDAIEVDGVAKTYKTIRFPLLDANGLIVGVGGVAADISAEREAIRRRDESIEELKLSRRETVEHLVRAIEHHDSSTGQHVKRLALVAGFLGAELGLDPDRVELLQQAVPMHDVGKIGVVEGILHKPGPLTASERAVMQEHTLTGHEILADSESDLLRLAATIALTHHERHDGTGYPNGLAAEEIPIEGRITAVADVFDALLSDRAYRPALPIAEVVSLLEKGRGTQFDPQIVDLLLENFDEALALREENL